MQTEIQRLTEAEIGLVDLVPQAVFAVSVQRFEMSHGLKFEHGSDDLDAYSALYLRVDSHTAAFIHHDAQPDDSLTLYLNRNLDRTEVDRLIMTILDLYHFDPAVVRWRESQDLRRPHA